jgi:hypothetical protein
MEMRFEGKLCHQELSNSMSHTTCTQGNQVDSRLFVVGSQIANLTLALLLAITCVSDVQMGDASPFWTSTFQGIFNDIKNFSSHSVLTPAIAF